jgi:hypothetical protein
LKFLAFERSYVIRFAYSVLIENNEVVDASLAPGSASLAEGTLGARSPLAAGTSVPEPEQATAVELKRTAVAAAVAAAAPVTTTAAEKEKNVLEAGATTAKPGSTEEIPRATATTVVQYCSSADEGLAADISNARDWPLIQSCAISELRGYDWWVLVGGQYANAIYNQVFGDAITEADTGFIVIRRADSFNYGGKDRRVWGVAGWSSSDTLSAVSYVIDNGLPERNVKQRY